QGVLRNLEVYPALTCLPAQLGKLLDGKTRVLGGDQGMRVGGHIRQFGNDLFLLRKIERHCVLRTGFGQAPARLRPEACTTPFHRHRRCLATPKLVAVPGKSRRASPSAQASPRPRGSGWIEVATTARVLIP